MMKKKVESFGGVDALVVVPMEMKEEEDDLGDLLGVGGCCCGDGDEGDGGG